MWTLETTQGLMMERRCSDGDRCSIRLAGQEFSQGQSFDYPKEKFSYRLLSGKEKTLYFSHLVLRGPLPHHLIITAAIY